MKLLILLMALLLPLCAAAEEYVNPMTVEGFMIRGVLEEAAGRG